MNVNNNKESNYTFAIEKAEDLEKFISGSEKAQRGLFELFNSSLGSLGHCNIDEAAINLNVGSDFAKAYWNSLGDGRSTKILEHMKAYKDLLKESMALCDKTLTPLLISALKCHREAFHLFPLEKEKAIKKMAETESLAKKITKEFKKLSEKFKSLREEIVNNMIELTEVRVSIYQKAENSEGEKIREILKKGSDKIECSIKSLSKIQTSLLNLKTFWSFASNSSLSLERSSLADSFSIKCLNRKEERNWILEISNFIEKDIKIINVSEKQPMKTGFQLNPSNHYQPTPFTDFLKTELAEGVEEEFEKSYLKWLALAKVNFNMITNMKAACDSNDLHLLDINLKLESNSRLKHSYK